MPRHYVPANGNSSQYYGHKDVHGLQSLTATGRHLPYGITVLPATQHKWTRPALTPASKLVLDLPNPAGRKAELT